MVWFSSFFTKFVGACKLIGPTGLGCWGLAYSMLSALRVAGDLVKLKTTFSGSSLSVAINSIAAEYDC